MICLFAKNVAIQLDIIEVKSSPAYDTNFYIKDWTGRGSSASISVTIGDTWDYATPTYKLDIAPAQDNFMLLEFTEPITLKSIELIMDHQVQNFDYRIMPYGAS